MKAFEKVTKWWLLEFCLMAIFAGIMVGIGGVSSLLASGSIGGGAGRLVGGLLFSLGMFSIISFDMRLFTGMVASIPTMGLKNTWKLPVCFLCNALGVAFVAVLAYWSPVREAVVPSAQALIGAKLGQEAWAISSFCSSVICGILITVSIWSAKFSPKKGLSVTVGVILPIVVFAFCGFDHSVANMLYFYYYGEVSWRVVGYILLSVLGNAVGGVLLPIATMAHHEATKK